MYTSVYCIIFILSLLGNLGHSHSCEFVRSLTLFSFEELRGHSSSGMMTRSTEVPTVRVSRTQSMISPTTIHVYSTSAETSVHLSSSVLPLHPSTSPPPGKLHLALQKYSS